MPLNVMDAHFRSFASRSCRALVQHGIGVLGMKPMGGGTSSSRAGRSRPIECLHYALNLPTSVVITGIDEPRVLDQAVRGGQTFHPLGDEAAGRAPGQDREDAAMAGKFELFKTSAHFDSTAHHPEWLGDESPEVKRLAPQGSG